MTGCSSDMMLARLLDEQLDRVDHASIVEHVESCVCCQERLKELTSDCSRLLGYRRAQSIGERSLADRVSLGLRVAARRRA